jgi:hypothetical protein
MNIPTRVVVCCNASTIVIIILWYGVSFVVLSRRGRDLAGNGFFLLKTERKGKAWSLFCKTYFGIGVVTWER